MTHRITALLFVAAIFMYMLGYATESGAICFVAFILECKFWSTVMRRERGAPRVTGRAPD